jgi:hypothetical protein
LRSYQSALAINDLITAVLLFSAVCDLPFAGGAAARSGYLFTAMAAIVHALSLSRPVRAPAGCSAPGSQTTVWLYMIWHGVFPLLVLGYSLLKGGGKGSRRYEARPRARL